MINAAFVIILIIILIILHEVAHYLSAKLMHLKIHRAGFKLVPLPHCFVEIEEVKGWKLYAFLYAGFSMTLTLFLIALYYNFWSVKQVCWAFLIQIIIETNPFFSDFVISFLYKKNMPHNLIYKKYLFSTKWYVHFLLWSLGIYLFVPSILP